MIKILSTNKAKLNKRIKIRMPKCSTKCQKVLFKKKTSVHSFVFFFLRSCRTEPTEQNGKFLNDLKYIVYSDVLRSELIYNLAGVFVMDFFFLQSRCRFRDIVM